MNFAQRLWDVFICWSRESGSKLLWIYGASHLHCCLPFMTKISAGPNAPSTIVRLTLLNDVHVSLRAWNWRQAVDPMLRFEYGWSLPFPFMVHFSFSADSTMFSFTKHRLNEKKNITILQDFQRSHPDIWLMGRIWRTKYSNRLSYNNNGRLYVCQTSGRIRTFTCFTLNLHVSSLF